MSRRVMSVNERLAPGGNYLIAIWGNSSVDSAQMENFVEGSAWLRSFWGPTMWDVEESEGGYVTAIPVECKNAVGVVEVLSYLSAGALAVGCRPTGFSVEEISSTTVEALSGARDFVQSIPERAVKAYEAAKEGVEVLSKPLLYAAVIAVAVLALVYLPRPNNAG